MLSAKLLIYVLQKQLFVGVAKRDSRHMNVWNYLVSLFVSLLTC